MIVGATVAVIPARGGSKGIPKKNLLPFCGRSLLSWSVTQAVRCPGVDAVYVSSDSDEILAEGERWGARAILRPAALASDEASSEAAWLHALEAIESGWGPVARMIGMQATSPLRETSDLARALAQFDAEQLDSMLSMVEISDFFVWRHASADAHDPLYVPVNYDYRERRRRQNIEPKYRENGSFYIFKRAVLGEGGNRLGGRIGGFVMAPHKMFQIDSPEDVQMCEVIMRGYGLDRQ